jgi:hypothetical protein
VSTRIGGTIVHQYSPDLLSRKVAAQSLKPLKYNIFPTRDRIVTRQNDIDIRIANDRFFWKAVKILTHLMSVSLFKGVPTQ